MPEIEGCDWLSNCLFLQRSHTSKREFKVLTDVVIGFQIVYFYREVTQKQQGIIQSILL